MLHASLGVPFKILDDHATLGARGSLAARFREMSGTAEDRPTGRRPATSGEAASERENI